MSAFTSEGGCTPAVLLKRPPAAFVETAQRVAGAFAQRNEGMFSAYPDVTWRDIQSEGVKRAIVAYADYDPEKSAPTTFIQLCTKRAMLDLLRSRSRSAAREQKVKEAWERGERRAWSEDAAVALEGEELVDLAARAYADAARSMERFRVAGRGRRGYAVATKAALLAVMRQQDLTARGMVKLLRRRPDVRRAVGIARVPDHKFFARLGKSGAKLRKRLVGVPTGCEGPDGARAAGAGTSGGRRLVEAGEGGRGPGGVEPGTSGRRIAGSGVGGRVAGGTGMVRGTESATERAIAARGPLITGRRAAELLGVTRKTLKDWRRQHRHLGFVREGGTPVLYLEKDVLALRERRRELVEVGEMAGVS